MSAAIAEELRESAGYLRDAGWKSVARVVQQAAAELDRQSERISELERSSRPQREVPRAIMRWRWRSAAPAAAGG